MVNLNQKTLIYYMFMCHQKRILYMMVLTYHKMVCKSKSMIICKPNTKIFMLLEIVLKIKCKEVSFLVVVKTMWLDKMFFNNLMEERSMHHIADIQKSTSLSVINSLLFGLKRVKMKTVKYQNRIY